MSLETSFFFNHILRRCTSSASQEIRPPPASRRQHAHVDVWVLSPATAIYLPLSAKPRDSPREKHRANHLYLEGGRAQQETFKALRPTRSAPGEGQGACRPGGSCLPSRPACRRDAGDGGRANGPVPEDNFRSGGHLLAKLKDDCPHSDGSWSLVSAKCEHLPFHCVICFSRSKRADLVSAPRHMLCPSETGAGD